MAHPRVQNVVTQQGNDISAILNEAADRYNLPPQVLLAQGIAESNLSETAARYGTWPDVSFGLWQQTVAYAPCGDASASPGNVAYVRERFTTDIPYAADVAAKQLGYYYGLHGSYEEASSRYNGGPRLAFADNPNQANIARAWAESTRYVEQEAVMGFAPIDVRDSFPFEGCELQSRPLASITTVVMHHGASAMPEPTVEAELAMLQAYHRLHVGKGFCCLAYHLAVGSSGNVYYCNNLSLISHHATTANPKSVGIVFIGNFSTAPPPDVMLDAAIRARQWAAQQCGRDDFPYIGHKDVAGDTACPGAWWPEPGQDLLAEVSDQEVADMGDAARIAELEAVMAEMARIAEEEALRTVNEALAVPGLPEAALTPLAHGAVPALNTIIGLGKED
jgi:hypothetical protein